MIRTIVLNVDVILGTDVVRHFNFAMNYGKLSAVADSSKSLSNSLSIIKNNFEIRFDGQRWIAKWNWKKNPVLRNRMVTDKMDENVLTRFRSEIKRWIGNDWLVKVGCSMG